MRGLFARKSVADFEEDVIAHGGLKRTLGKWHLTALGVGATIGAGIFVTTGTAIVGDPLRPGAGPAIIFSFLLTAVACGFAALCYAEFAAMVPIAGSAYTYAYAALGEKAKAEEMMGRLLFVTADAEPNLRILEIAKATGVTGKAHDASPGTQRNYLRTSLEKYGPNKWEPYAAPALAVKDANGKAVTLADYKGKNVMLVDDSIVRGTTCKQIIQMAREAGAKNVYFCSAAPAVRYPNVYGIDMPSVHELIAHNRTTEQVAELIGADWLVYQDLPDLIDSVGGGKIKIDQFDCAVFNGEYVTGDIDEAYLDRIEQARNDLAKAKNQAVSAIIDLYNN